ncbi:leucyl aminopeptidase [Methylocella sp.]|uniref:leucyl aminopeptidase n=1 Tax=Methylocella sp. TaxID=1978226 RepID=UPI003783A93A
MPQAASIQFVALDALKLAPQPGGAEPIGTLAVFVGPDLALGEKTRKLLGAEAEALLRRAAAAAKFKGKASSALEILAPAGLGAERLLAIGAGGPSGDKRDGEEAQASGGKEPDAPPSSADYANLGGYCAGKIGRGKSATILFDLPRPPQEAAAAASDFALGLRLRDYRFDRYKTKKKDDAEDDGPTELRVAVAEPDAARAAAAKGEAVAEGVITARTLVNEPPNVLFPEEFANRAKALEKLGVEVEILDEAAMRGLGMGALLGVSQGSAREGRLVLMRWRGAPAGADEKPVAFIGKGVTFDTGGISIKPAGGMEDMKGDMAGAACVVGLIEALARRKAKVDAIGAIGLVENMPGPDAQRPGDIVTSLSGQTIEIINTDAEGRLVLCDVLWHVQDRFKPKFMIDLATLTGAILVALGQEHAGLFSNNDELAERLLAAGRETGEKLWRMPLGPAYDKLIDSKFADVKNAGGRHAGSITAAQFLQRFVNGTPWAHLDIAGTGMASPSGDVNQSWGSGYGVRLLDRLVADCYES